MIAEHQSVLIKVRPDGAEERYCGVCGEFYLLPIPYDTCNPKSRDCCIECIHAEQIRRPNE
jgi:hypothetical protein